MLRVILLLIISAALAAVFLSYPSLDISISTYFFDLSKGGFYLENSIFAKTVYFGVRVLCVAVVIYLCYQTFSTFKRTHSFHYKKYLDPIYLGAVLLIGPGILVHNVIKVFFSRPRPRQVVEFGGDFPFEQIFDTHYYCMDCHSFVSGHASIGFFFVAFALISHKPFTRIALTLFAIIFGCFIGSARIMAGAHFASDVVFAGAATFLAAYLLYIPYTILRHKI